MPFGVDQQRVRLIEGVVVALGVLDAVPENVPRLVLRDGIVRDHAGPTLEQALDRD